MHGAIIENPCVNADDIRSVMEGFQVFRNSLALAGLPDCYPKNPLFNFSTRTSRYLVHFQAFWRRSIEPGTPTIADC